MSFSNWHWLPPAAAAILFIVAPVAAQPAAVRATTSTLGLDRAAEGSGGRLAPINQMLQALRTLDLTKEQKRKLADLRMRAGTRFRALQERVRPAGSTAPPDREKGRIARQELRELTETVASEINALLTPAQREDYERQLAGHGSSPEPEPTTTSPLERLSVSRVVRTPAAPTDQSTETLKPVNPFAPE